MISTCNIYNHNPIISVSENKMTFTICNSSRVGVNKVTVDGCYMSSSSKKCDFLFEIISSEDEVSKVYYVELKGRNIEHAIEQLISTMSFCKTEHRGIYKECHIVCSRVPKAGPESQIFKSKFLKATSVQLFINTRIHTVNV